MAIESPHDGLNDIVQHLERDIAVNSSIWRYVNGSVLPQLDRLVAILVTCATLYTSRSG